LLLGHPERSRGMTDRQRTVCITIEIICGNLRNL
jgi:hypothetical protein